MTILEKRKYAVIDGTVDAVYELQMGKVLTPGQIQIGGKVYNADITLLPCQEIELVGRRVIAYYSADADAIIHIEKKGEQDVLTIKSRDIAGTPTISQYQYIDANSKTKTERIENGVVIYNGELLGTGSVTASKLKPNSGEVTLMDTDGNNVYDMIYVIPQNFLMWQRIAGTILMYRVHMKKKLCRELRMIYSEAESGFQDRMQRL